MQQNKMTRNRRLKQASTQVSSLYRPTLVLKYSGSRTIFFCAEKKETIKSLRYITLYLQQIGHGSLTRNPEWVQYGCNK